MQELFGYLSGACIILGFIPYLRDILRGQTRPERATWFLWSVLIVIAFFAQWAQGASWSLVLTGVDGVVVIAIFLLSLRRGVGGFMRRDIVSLILSAFGLLLWYITKSPTVALVVTLGVDALGAYLTVAKTYQHPQTETLFAWAMGVVAGIFGLLALSEWSLGLALYPFYIALANLAVVVAILAGRRANPQSAHTPGEAGD